MLAPAKHSEDGSTKNALIPEKFKHQFVGLSVDDIAAGNIPINTIIQKMHLKNLRFIKAIVIQFCDLKGCLLSQSAKRGGRENYFQLS